MAMEEMDDDLFYDRYQLVSDCLAEVKNLPPQDLYAQLAEEGAELTEVYTINDNDKERIKAFVRSIQDEWERRTDG